MTLLDRAWLLYRISRERKASERRGKLPVSTLESPELLVQISRKRYALVAMEIWEIDVNVTSHGRTKLSADTRRSAWAARVSPGLCSAPFWLAENAW